MQDISFPDLGGYHAAFGCVLVAILQLIIPIPGCACMRWFRRARALCWVGINVMPLLLLIHYRSGDFAMSPLPLPARCATGRSMKKAICTRTRMLFGHGACIRYAPRSLSERMICAVEHSLLIIAPASAIATFRCRVTRNVNTDLLRAAGVQSTPSHRCVNCAERGL